MAVTAQSFYRIPAPSPNFSWRSGYRRLPGLSRLWAGFPFLGVNVGPVVAGWASVSTFRWVRAFWLLGPGPGFSDRHR